MNQGLKTSKQISLNFFSYNSMSSQSNFWETLGSPHIGGDISKLREVYNYHLTKGQSARYKNSRSSFNSAKKIEACSLREEMTFIQSKWGPVKSRKDMERRVCRAS